jgi:hypothetical protein
MNKMLGLSKAQIDLRLIQTQSTIETLKIVNRHNKRVSLKAKLCDFVKGIDIMCPKSLEPLSACDVTIEIN